MSDSSAPWTLRPGRELFPEDLVGVLRSAARSDARLHRLWLARWDQAGRTIAAVVAERSDAELSPQVMTICDRAETVQRFTERGLRLAMCRAGYEITAEDIRELGAPLVERPLSQVEVPRQRPRQRFLAVVACIELVVGLVLAAVGVGAWRSSADLEPLIVCSVLAALFLMIAGYLLLYRANAWAVDGLDHVEAANALGRARRIDHVDVHSVIADPRTRVLTVRSYDGRKVVLHERQFVFPRFHAFMHEVGLPGVRR